MIDEHNVGKACREVMLILAALPARYTHKIPREIYLRIRERQDMDHHPCWEGKIDHNADARQLNLLHETLTLMAWLNLEFWETSEEKKKELWTIYEKNGRKQEMEQMEIVEQQLPAAQEE